MQYEEFIDRVQERSGLDSRDRSITITRATLDTLGERLERKIRRNVAAQLPNELKDHLLTGRDPDRYPLEEFYNRVGARCDEKVYDAAERTKAVMSVLQEALSPGQVDEMLASLPDEYSALFDGSPGPGFPSLDRS